MSTKSRNINPDKSLSSKRGAAALLPPYNSFWSKCFGPAFFTVFTFAFFCALLFLTCPYTLEMQESRATMYYVQELVSDLIIKPGGVSELLALMVVQLFGCTWAAVSITALIATLATTIFGHILCKIISSRNGDTLVAGNGSKVLVWNSALSLAIIPVSAVLLMFCNPSYSYSGLVAFSLMMVALWLYLLNQQKIFRPVIALVIAVVLYWAAGAVAFLYSLIVFILEIRRNTRTCFLYLSCAIAVWTMGVAFVRVGWYANHSQALTPACYYTAWRTAPSILWAPWAAIISVVLISELLPALRLKTDRSAMTAATVCALSSLAISAAMAISLRQPAEEKYAQLSLLVGKGQWQETVKKSRNLDINDYRSQNCRNIALAQTGQLSNSLFTTPCAGPQALITMSDKSPETYMTLSDIFYAIGHYSLAQKYAFEANQGLGNMSPRMLKRLAEISIINGQDEVAKKYLHLLYKTLRYADWANNQLTSLSDEKIPRGARSDTCISSFAGINGLEYDLKEIVRHDTRNRIAMDYLGMWLLASKRVPEFADAISEFYGTEVLIDPLPKHFQEALAVASLATDSRLDLKYNLHPTTVDHCRQFWANHRDYPNTFWHYLKYGGQPDKNSSSELHKYTNF